MIAECSGWEHWPTVNFFMLLGIWAILSIAWYVNRQHLKQEQQPNGSSGTSDDQN